MLTEYQLKVLLEVVGYCGSLLVIISMLMTSVVKLRIINSLGSVINVFYALCIGSFPVALMNAVLVAINCYNLYRLNAQKAEFYLVKGNLSEAGAQHFLRIYREDIRNYFPHWDSYSADNQVAYFVYVGTTPVGLLAAKDLGEGSLGVQLDYSAPQYRDCSVGSFLYKALPKEGVTSLVAQGGVAKHEEYLQKMGFHNKHGQYIKTL